jgi:hypothetical protein
MQANQIIRLHQDEGVRTALVVKVTPQYVRLIWPDSAGMKIRKLRNDRYLRYDVLEYSVRECKRRMRKMCKAFGSTKTARAALRG